MGKVLEATNISFYYGSNAILDNISLQINEGDFIGIIGPNGSGKSTMIKALLGLIKVQEGNIYVSGTNINRFKDWGCIGYIPQKATAFNQSFPATVEEVIAANLYPKIGLTGKMTQPYRKKIDEVLEIVGMSEYRKRLIGKLSGGQQQRVFIAKALVSEPKVIFMDEPTVGIDRKSEESFYELMGFLNENKKITIIMITHDVGAISKKVNRIFCISEGKLLEHCSVDGCCDVYSNSMTVPI